MKEKDIKIVLSKINKKWKWLARDLDGELYAYSSEPKKNTVQWATDGQVYNKNFISFELLDSLFDFIKWEDAEPYSIEKLLEEEHITKVPKLKKLKDLTFEEYKKWTRKNCTNTKCSECPFKYASCDVNEEICWINGKNMYSNEFLNQEIEIEQ